MNRTGLLLHRFSPVRLTRVNAYAASVDELRRRGLRVLTFGRWLLIYTPRDHWSRHL